MYKGDEASPRIVSAGSNFHSFSENAHNSWTAWYILYKFCIRMYFSHCQATGLQNGDEALSSIILASRALFSFNESAH